MATKILDSLDHYCYHAPRLVTHHHPNLHHCIQKDCPGAIAPDIAAKAGLTETDGTVKCPLCNCDTYPKGEWKEAEVHVELCTDETIHYPRMYRAGKLDKDKFEAWKATLSREELLGYYKRIPTQHVVAKLTRDEAALMDNNQEAFLSLVNARVKESSERMVLHQMPYRHKTTTEKPRLSK